MGKWLSPPVEGTQRLLGQVILAHLTEQPGRHDCNRVGALPFSLAAAYIHAAR